MRRILFIFLLLVLFSGNLTVLHAQPAAVTLQATNITETSATLVGMVITSGQDTQWMFEYSGGSIENKIGQGPQQLDVLHYTVDWALSNPSLSPPSPKLGDLATFNIIVTQVSSDWPGSLSVGLNVNLDGNKFEYVWVYQNQPGPIPVGITKTVSTKPWTATAGAHLVTWELMFFGGDETVIITDPFPDNKASLQFSVGAAASSTQPSTTTIVQSVTQSSTEGAPAFTIRQSDLVTIGLIAAVVILIAVIALRRPRHAPYAPPPPPTTVRSTAVATGFCINCGAPLKPDVKFCRSCGQRVE